MPAGSGTVSLAGAREARARPEALWRLLRELRWAVMVDEAGRGVDGVDLSICGGGSSFDDLLGDRRNPPCPCIFRMVGLVLLLLLHPELMSVAMHCLCILAMVGFVWLLSLILKGEALGSMAGGSRRRTLPLGHSSGFRLSG